MSSLLPSNTQSQICSILCLLLSAVTLPFVLVFTVGTYLLATYRGTLTGTAKPLLDSNGKLVTVLVNGGRMNKSLTVARAMSKLGARVILVEEKGWGDVCATRFSSSVSKFRILPRTSSPAGKEAYVRALYQIAREEDCTLFIPCSGAHTTVEDAKAAEIMKANIKGFRAIIQSPQLAKTLHEKDLFMDLVNSLGDLLAPTSHTVHSVSDALEVIKTSSQPLILKFSDAGDDTGRSDLTTYPLEGDDEELSKTRKRLEGLRIPIGKETPYALQQYIGGGTEWCTHASVVDGKLVAFACCPSSDMLMTYYDATYSEVGQMAEEYTRSLIAKLNVSPEYASQKPISGPFSLDFILASNRKDLYVIECNPRIHTAALLLPSIPFAQALLGHNDDKIVRPLKGTAPRSWVAHDIPSRILPFLLPQFVRENLHPLLVVSPFVKAFQGQTDPQDQCWFWNDPNFDVNDPMPFIGMMIQVTALLVWKLTTGTGWSRLNVSTARVFEC
nr:TPA_exp: ATP grasp ligase [Phaffia brasiliana]DBA07229.1 TPA_exp: ATP grasp ligase [Phaffia brasiliana]